VSDTPICLKPYRYPQVQKAEIERQVQALLETGFIRESASSYAAPLVLVMKKDGSWRCCTDFRKLNAFTVKNKFPMPLIEDLLDELQGACYFTKLDLKCGYNQVRMEEQDIHKTAFQTHNGHYEWVVLPFGLCNAPATFQSLMNDIFRQHLRRFILVFFDDILFYTKTCQEHMECLQTTLEILRNNCMVVNFKKCSFGKQQVEYLGHIISAAGVAPDKDKVAAVESWPRPKTVKEFSGYYRRFIFNYGKIAAPLTSLLKKEAVFHWTDSAEIAFVQFKQALVTAPVLALPNFKETFTIETNASGGGIGAVLLQKGHPIAFISKAMGPKYQLLSA
jgi:hypothetical protein